MSCYAQSVFSTLPKTWLHHVTSEPPLCCYTQLFHRGFGCIMPLTSLPPPTMFAELYNAVCSTPELVTVPP